MIEKVRAHSKFSASGAERWFNCQGSVALSEGLPDKSSVWAIEGTLAHYWLEQYLRHLLSINGKDWRHMIWESGLPSEMIAHVKESGEFIYQLYKKTPDAIAKVETRIYLNFIHPEAFGTFDSAVVDYFGTLHVFDFKYGAGHQVRPKENLQMIFYGMGLAHKYQWNFKRVRLWIIQPRIKGYDGPAFWDIGIMELKQYVGIFKNAIDKVEKHPDKFVEGSWCHWCKAKSICPLKIETKRNAIKNIFLPVDKGFK